MGWDVSPRWYDEPIDSTGPPRDDVGWDAKSRRLVFWGGNHPIPLDLIRLSSHLFPSSSLSLHIPTPDSITMANGDIVQQLTKLAETYPKELGGALVLLSALLFFLLNRGKRDPIAPLSTALSTL